jgi:glutamine---fructose-6-phosphate transaminase (isomerizing)
VFYTRAGAEIGVASTKAFTTHLAAPFTLAVTLADLRGVLSAKQEAEYRDCLRHLPGSVQHALNLEPQIAEWAKAFAGKQRALFLGRGIHYLLCGKSANFQKS